LRYAATEFPTTIVRTHTIEDFHFTETEYGRRVSLTPHAHERACVVVVLDGTFHERANGRRRVVGPRSLIVRPAGEVHSNRVESGGRCLNIELPVGFGVASSVIAAHDGLENDDAESRILCALTGRIPPEWLIAVRHRMRDAPGVKMKLNDLADFAGVHPVHLAATFHRFYGTPVAAYLRRVRIEAACRQLSQSDASIADIAQCAGFADQSHLGRVLKRTIGMTPAEYRLKNVLSTPSRNQ
jgi:AraC family transcriptional regulator